MAMQAAGKGQMEGKASRGKGQLPSPEPAAGQALPQWELWAGKGCLVCLDSCQQHQDGPGTSALGRAAGACQDQDKSVK